MEFTISEDWSAPRELDWVEMVLGRNDETDPNLFIEEYIALASKELAKQIDQEILKNIFIDGNFLPSEFSTTKIMTPSLGSIVKIDNTVS